jgi:DNA-binding SARP family transcriptional activator
MEALRIHLFGGLDVSRGGRALPGFATQKAKGLFAYLALHRGRRHSREVLVGRFWGEAPEAVARKNFRTDLWRVRTVLEPDGVEPGSCLSVSHDEVALAPAAGHWLDVHEFEETLDSAAPGPAPELTEAQTALLRQAVALYRGDLLEGLYEDWCLFERERLRLRYLEALERLMRHHGARAEWAEAAGCGQRLLAHDPLREHVHRLVARCHLARGDRAAALRQYEACERLLRQELGVEPTAETRALLGEVRGEAPPPPSGPRSSEPSSPAALDEVLARLRSAAAWLDETGEQVRIVIRDVERARTLSS